MRGFWLRIVAVALIVTTAVAVAAVVTLERRHHVIFAGPRMDHAQHLPQQTKALVRVEPLLGEELLAGLAGGQIPRWALSRILPYEIVIAFSLASVRGEIGLTAVVNEQRLGPGISNMVNEYIAQGALPAVRWPAGGMAPRERGLLLAVGSAPMNPMIREAWASVWNPTPPRTPIAAEGGRFVEIALDNREGEAFAILGTLLMGDVQTAPEQGLDPVLIAETLADITSCRATAHPAGKDALAIHIEIACRDAIEEGTKGMFQFFYEMAYQELRKQAQFRGASLEGASEWHGTRLVGVYTLEGVSRLLGS